MGRRASTVLVSPTGALLGMLPAVDLDCPYWPESADVVAELSARFGVQVVMLRLLTVETGRKSGGAVTYLAELATGAPRVPLLAIPDDVRARAERPDPKRLPWAERGGPARSLAWARSVLGDFAAVQQRTWNLSTLWRLQPASGVEAVWLKQTPPFMHHEGAILRWLNDAVPSAAPTLLSDDGDGRNLLAHVDGHDLYGAPADVRQQINVRLHDIQRAAASAVDELVARGVPDRRGHKRGAHIRRTLTAWSADHPGLDRLLRRLDETLDRLDDCGLPATLVHGDNHPGNARGSTRGMILLDWGDAFIGDPVTDLLRMTDGLSAAEAAPLKARWCESWKRFAPRSTPEAALSLAPFLTAMHGAAIFADFLAQIEETEWPYHRDDPPACLQLAESFL